MATTHTRTIHIQAKCNVELCCDVQLEKYFPRSTSVKETNKWFI